ncbi:carboxypeptidase KEX1 precursor [Nannizzia gypsea CBS 118893]|uniref:Pheromone-processing carboxypeptidase KEX1 n=1 Tax=Arthroderma gypseum (strain ATCC MYA-4604 / CBS 118893) TaxID=535722 RepID=E5QZG5_ARTGP|nr:carboxypeptidase KEX1 precursor [Nannizzia gypsea CBS 118893]EFQ98970.1 carboxypeptidase KEX1 precursor [Nannizzia gypsea CBS 118893]
MRCLSNLALLPSSTRARCAWLLLLLSNPAAVVAKCASDYFVRSLPGQPEGPLLKMHAGHIEIDPEHKGNLFFWHYQNRHIANRQRTVIWLNGGPGCSSMDGALMEIGPYRLKDDHTLTYNNGSWDEFANLLFVDQPVGTGFSYVTNDKLSAKDTAWNVQGLLIGNGWISPLEQYRSYLPFSYKEGVLEKSSDGARAAEVQLSQCMSKLKDVGKFGVHVDECERILELILDTTKADGKCLNMYDIRLKDTDDSCGMNWPPDISSVTSYLRRADVVKALNINEDKTSGWRECSPGVGRNLKAAESVPSIQLLPGLLERGIPIILFSGDKDLICNHIGAPTSVGAHPNSTTAEEKEKEKIKIAAWEAYYKSGEVALVVVAIAASLWGVFIWRSKRRENGLEYKGIYPNLESFSSASLATFRGKRRGRMDVESAPRSDEAELETLYSAAEGSEPHDGGEECLSGSKGSNEKTRGHM